MPLRPPFPIGQEVFPFCLSGVKDQSMRKPVKVFISSKGLLKINLTTLIESTIGSFTSLDIMSASSLSDLYAGLTTHLPVVL